MGVIYAIADFIGYFIRHTIYGIIKSKFGPLALFVFIVVVAYIWFRLKKS